MRFLWLISLALLLAPRLALAAALPHVCAEVTTNVTTSSSTMVDVTGATLASGNFTTGNPYLIVVTAQPTFTASDGTELQMIHGSTAFAGSEHWVRVNDSGATRQVYPFMALWTAVSSEGVALQHKSRLGGANVAGTNMASVCAFDFSGLTAGVDYGYNEVSTDTGSTTSFQDGASVTMPAGTYLVIGNVQMDAGGQATNYPIVRLTDGTTNLPKAQLDVGHSALDEYNYGLARCFTAAGSTTYKVQHAVSASTTANHLHSKILALKLATFAGASCASTDAAQALSASDYGTQLQTLNVTPTVQGDVWIGAYWSFDRNNASRVGEFRVQVDNSDQPAGQTAANYQFQAGLHPDDEDDIMLSTLVADMTAASHTIDLDASSDSTTGTPEGETRTIWAIPMELSSTRRPMAPMVFP